MLKKAIIGAVALLVLLAGGAFLAVRMLLDPESVRTTIEAQASAALGERVTLGAASVGLWPRARVVLSDLRVGDPASLTLDEVELSTAMRALLSRRIEDADVIVEHSTLELPRLLAVLDRLGTDAAPAGAETVPSEPAITLVNVRTIALRDVTVRAGGRQAVFDLDSSLQGDRLDVASASVKSDVTTLTASGVVESLRARKATLTLTADPLDLDGLMTFAQAFTTPASPGSGGPETRPAAAPASTPPVPVDVTLDVKAARGRAAGVAFDALAARARLTPGRLAFEPFGFGLFGGRLEGSVALETSGPEPAVSIAGTMSGIDMTRLTEFTGQSGSVTGTLGGTLSIAGAGSGLEQALARATGEGAVTIADGTMKGLQLVRTIVLAFGQPNLVQPTEGGEAFSRLGARFSLAKGVVTLSDLSFVSRDVDVAGDGTLTLAGSRLDVRARAMLSKELTEQAGRDLVRYTAVDGRVTVPATVTGTVGDPAVRVDVGGTLNRAVTNELQRRSQDLKREAESAIKGLLRKKP
jgi:uncharacterized protein involved in outer membrane biogenesis